MVTKRLAHAGLLKLDRLLETVERPLAAAEDRGRQDGGEVFDAEGGKGLTDHVGRRPDHV